MHPSFDLLALVHVSGQTLDMRDDVVFDGPRVKLFAHHGYVGKMDLVLVAHVT